MVILDIYKKIDSIIISYKLGVTISNLPKDWQEEVVEDMIDEINKSQLTQSDIFLQYDLNKIYRLHFKDMFSYEGLTDKELLEQFANFMIGIQVEDVKASLLRLKNNYMASPTCEKEFCEKFINFLSFVVDHRVCKNEWERWYSPTWIYSSERSLFEESRVLNHLSFAPPKVPELEAYQRSQISDDNKIYDLIALGKMVDQYLETKNDFWKLDYIINSIFDDNNFNSYHLFKMVTLLEMLLVSPTNSGKVRELDTKLQPFLPEDIPLEKREKLCILIRQIRNKIGHGDFLAMNQKLEEYADEFMKGFWFDYYELSRQNWILSNICCLLNIILANVLWLMLSNKKKLAEIIEAA